MEAEPAPIGPRNLLCLAKEGHEKEQHKIGIDLGLQLEIARVILRVNFALAGLELERGVEGVINFLHESNERPDVAIVHTRARIVTFQLFDEPARVIDAYVKLITGPTEEGAREVIQFTGGRAGGFGKMGAAMPIDQAIFEIDPNLGVGSLEEPLNLTEERFVQSKSDGLESSSRFSNCSES